MWNRLFAAGSMLVGGFGGRDEDTEMVTIIDQSCIGRRDAHDARDTKGGATKQTAG
jgi:hypothetical protein